MDYLLHLAAWPQRPEYPSDTDFIMCYLIYKTKRDGYILSSSKVIITKVPRGERLRGRVGLPGLIIHNPLSCINTGT